MPIELINSMRNSVWNLVTASGKCVRSLRQRPGPGACHGVGVVIVLSASVIVFSFAAGSHRAVDTGGEVKSGAHLELEFVGCRAGKSTSPPVSLLHQTQGIR